MFKGKIDTKSLLISFAFLTYFKHFTTLKLSLQCKLDFCWVCLEPWKKHSSSTGGYFRCNRFEAVNKADERQGVLISEV